MAPDYLKKYAYDAEELYDPKSKKTTFGKHRWDQPTKHSRIHKRLLLTLSTIESSTFYIRIFSKAADASAKLLKLGQSPASHSRSKPFLEWCRKITEAFETAGIKYVVYKGLCHLVFYIWGHHHQRMRRYRLLNRTTGHKKAHTIMNTLGFFTI